MNTPDGFLLPSSSIAPLLPFPNKCFRAVFFLLTLLSFLPPTNAQSPPHPTFRHYTTDDGLASPEVYCILQDRQGLIWISSDNGVSRFDGYEFRNYGLKDGLPENVIFLMQLDTLGRVWMQAMSGNLYYLDGETICPYRHNGVLRDFTGRPDFGKGFIVEGGGETVHIATLKYGVITIFQDGTTQLYPHPDPFYWQVFEKNGIAINACFDGAEPARQKAYQDQLHREKRSAPVYLQIGDAIWSFPDLYYSAIAVPASEAFRLAEGKYFFQLYNDVWFIEEGIVQWRYHFPHRILHARVQKNGQLFVGLQSDQGLRVYPSIDSFRKEKGTTWLRGRTVSFFMEDREGGQWFGTNKNGVFYAPADAFRVHDLETGLSDEKVAALALKNGRAVYAGLMNGEVWLLDQPTGIWTELPATPEAGPVRDLHFEPREQRLWLGKASLYYQQKRQWARSEVSVDGRSVSMANHITESPGGQRLWVCHHNGFMSLELPSLRADDIHLGYDQRTYVVREDLAGRVWVGQPGGLFEWKEGTLIGHQHLHPAFSLRVEDLVLLPDSTLVVATKGGGVVFWKDDLFEQLTTDQGLTADMMECLYVDDRGVLWAGTLNGLNRITGKWGERKVEPITIFHGLPSNEINCVRGDGENIWVATPKGLVQFSKKEKSPYSPRPILASILANGQALDQTLPLSLRANENNLTLRFFAINYKMNGKIPYRYRMDGGDWLPTLDRTLNFPALPPGERLFEVQARNEDGVWSPSTTLRIVIHPPWWGTWWARTGVLIGTFALLLGIYRYRTGQLKRANQIQQQITELERSALQAQMNPHFIFNCLNSIQNYILQNEKESAILYLGRFASLVRSMLHASVTGKILLAEEVKLLNHYLELEKLRFKDRFTYEVRTAEELDVFEVEIPPLLVQPYVENAVLHGISGRTIGGKVTVFFEKKEAYLEVTIRDNGPGLESKELPPGKEDGHKSVGMSITRTRLELLSDGRKDQAVHFQTLYHEDGGVAGTQITIRVGLGEGELLEKKP